jgi:hypothetical protein
MISRPVDVGAAETVAVVVVGPDLQKSRKLDGSRAVNASKAFRTVAWVDCDITPPSRGSDARWAPVTVISKFEFAAVSTR